MLQLSTQPAWRQQAAAGGGGGGGRGTAAVGAEQRHQECGAGTGAEWMVMGTERGEMGLMEAKEKNIKEIIIIIIIIIVGLA